MQTKVSIQWLHMIARNSSAAVDIDHLCTMGFQKKIATNRKDLFASALKTRSSQVCPKINWQRIFAAPNAPHLGLSFGWRIGLHLSIFFSLVWGCFSRARLKQKGQMFVKSNCGVFSQRSALFLHSFCIRSAFPHKASPFDFVTLTSGSFTWPTSTDQHHDFKSSGHDMPWQKMWTNPPAENCTVP